MSREKKRKIYNWCCVYAQYGYIYLLSLLLNDLQAEGWVKPTGTGLGKASTARNGHQTSEQPKHTGCRPLPTNVDNAQPTRPPIGGYIYNELQLEKLINSFAAVINTAPIHGKRYWLRVDFWRPPPLLKGKKCVILLRFLQEWWCLLLQCSYS